jgi:hypothetical protein
MRSKLDNLDWLEPPAEHDMTRPGSGSEWVGAFVAMAVFVALALSGLMILLSSWGNAWFWLWVLPAGLLIGLGVYGVARGLSGMFRPAKPMEYHLTNLELSYEQTLGPLGEVLIRGNLRSEVIGKNVPKSLHLTLHLQPEHHEFDPQTELNPVNTSYLNHSETRFTANNCEFVIEVPRHQTVFETTHCALEINFADQPVFYRLNLEPIAQTPPIRIVFQPSRREQLEAFQNGDADELISRAYNGEQASAGWLRHHGGPYLQDFSLEEQSRVFTVSFAELIDHLEKINWFANKCVDVLESPFDGMRIFCEAGLYKIMSDQSDQQLTWFTRFYETRIEREAHEAFVLHSDSRSWALGGAMELLEFRSIEINHRPAQSY